MFVAALFTIAKKWKQPNCLSLEGRINKRGAVGFYSAIEGNEVPTHAVTRMSLGNSMTQKATVYDAIYMKFPE